MSEKKDLNIYQKLIEVRKGLEGFKKDTDGYGYKYVSGSQVLSGIKKDMDRLGIILEPHLLNPTAESSNKGYLITSNMKMIWVNADNPKDKIEIFWFMTGEQKDPSQAFGSGLTYTERYFLMKFFNVPTDEDDPDKSKNIKNNELPEKSPEITGEIKPKVKSGDVKFVTERQIKRYYAMVKEAEIDINKMDNWVKKHYGVEHKKALTMAQIDEIFDKLEKKIEEKKAEAKIEDGFNKTGLLKGNRI